MALAAGFRFAPDAPVAPPAPPPTGDVKPDPKPKEKGDKAADDGKPGDQKPADETKTLTLSEAELNLRIEKAQQEERERIAEERKTADAKAAKDKAKQDNDFKALYESEQGRAAELEQANKTLQVEVRTLRVRIQLNDYLGKNAAEYVGSAEYILPLIKVDEKTKDGDVEGLIKTAVEKFVKDNPRQVSASTPASSPRGKSLTPIGGTRPPEPPRPDAKQDRLKRDSLGYTRQF